MALNVGQINISMVATGDELIRVDQALRAARISAFSGHVYR
jgi:hypothetical protein